MHISPQEGLGITVSGFNPHSTEDVSRLAPLAYAHKIVVLKDLDLPVSELRKLGELCGRVEPYYEEMYHHPDDPAVFVSSNITTDNKQVGVPKTGAFWHSDYQFKAEPFDLTFIAPQVVPARGRGTFYVDLAAAYRALPKSVQRRLAGVTATHSVRRYFKIRPSDVYRPLSELIAEVDARTPPVTVPAVQTHRFTGEQLIYVSEGFTEMLTSPDGTPAPDLLAEVLELTGQTDPECGHPGTHTQRYEVGDLVVWDNRCLVHRALHTAGTEPAVSHRVTVYDETTAPGSVTPATGVPA